MYDKREKTEKGTSCSLSVDFQVRWQKTPMDDGGDGSTGTRIHLISAVRQY